MRDKILALAEEQMKEGGYEALNFGKIAKDLDTTRANLHYHYKNKESLAMEVLKNFTERDEKDALELASAYKGNFPEFLEQFENMIIAHIEENFRCGSCVCSQVVKAKDVPEGLLKYAQEHFSRIGEIIATAVVDSQESGVIKKDIKPEILSLRAGMMLMGLGQMGLVYGDRPESIQDLRGSLKSWIKGYLA